MNRIITIIILSIFLYLAISENWELKRNLRDAKEFVYYYQTAVATLGYTNRWSGRFVVIDTLKNDSYVLDVNTWLENN